MNIETIRTETANALNCSPNELIYINDSLLQLDKQALPADLNSGDAFGRQSGNRWGSYCNSIVKYNNRVYFSCGPKSASGDYACEILNRYYVPVSHVQHQEQAGQCSRTNVVVYFIGNYKGGGSEYGMEQIEEDQ